MSREPRLPTAPGGVPLLGHVPRLRRDPLAYLRTLRDTGDLVTLRLGPRRAVLVTSPELVRRVLVTDARSFDKGAMFDDLRLRMGNGLVVSDGEFHRRQRRMAQPAFHPDRVDHYVRAMTHRTGERIAHWRPHTPLDLTGELDELALDILLDTLIAPAGTALGEAGAPGTLRAEPPDPARTALRAAAGAWLTVKSGALRRTLSPLAAWRARLRPAAPRPAADERPAELRRLLAGEIDRCRAAGTDRGDLLSALVAARTPDGATAMTDTEIGDELLTLLVAGTGTVSAALAWTFTEIARHPEAARALEEEADAVLGGRAATAADLPRLRRTERFLREVLRCHAVWLLMRRTVTTVRLGGVTLPPGTEVLLSPHALHHDPDHFAEPDRFDPERWRTAPPGRGSRHAYLPFGAGNRQCAGDGYAWAEMAVVVATVTGRWRLLPAPGDRPRPRVGTVVRPERLLMTPVPR
ncbi:cytochrome P450 [Streptomyces sp. NPDC000594]|uniref:cytochrome P450 n=1 Tax=Streptomyces sp. NPDC000594 TaxID=3154261 RepID=UPI003320373E